MGAGSDNGGRASAGIGSRIYTTGPGIRTGGATTNGGSLASVAAAGGSAPVGEILEEFEYAGGGSAPAGGTMEEVKSAEGGLVSPEGEESVIKED